VTHCEYLGADTVLGCTVSGHRLLVRLPGLVELPRGHTVHLAFDEALHLFDASTGRRVEPATAEWQEISA
jgi:ABC-type sugar transport system ATPase subunit